VGLAADSRVIRDAGVPLPTMANYHCVVAVDDSRLFFLHGRDAHFFDLDLNVWTRIPQRPQFGREGHVCGVVDQTGEIVVAGGAGRTTNVSVEIFSVIQGTWRSGPDLPRALAHSQSLR
jgi:hypothetical protein